METTQENDRPQNHRISWPLDVLMLIGVGNVNLAISFAIACRIDLESYGCFDGYGISDYITKEDGDWDYYFRVTRFFRAKVGESILMHMIEENNVAVLQLFNRTCRTYYNFWHLIRAMKVGLGVTACVLAGYEVDSDTFYRVCLEMFYGLTCAATEAFELVMVAGAITHEQIEEVAEKMFAKQDHQSVAFCDYFGLDITGALPYADIRNTRLNVIRALTERNLYVPDAGTVLWLAGWKQRILF